MITTMTNNTINVEMFIFTLLKLTITNTISILLFSDLKSQTLLEINDDVLTLPNVSISHLFQNQYRIIFQSVEDDT